MKDRNIPNGEYREWRRAHGYAEEPVYPSSTSDKKGGGTAIIVGILAVLGLAGLGLGLAAASAKPSGGKKATKISSLVAQLWEEGNYIRYYWDGHLQDVDGSGLNGKTIKLQLQLEGSSTWTTIDTQTTRTRGGASDNGYFFFYKLYPKPMARFVRIIFEGDDEYLAVNLWYDTTNLI